MLFENKGGMADTISTAGPVVKENGVLFRVWAPEKQTMQLHIVSPDDQLLEMQKVNDGYWELLVPQLGAGTRYFYKPDGDNDFPDPASRFQPEGVHGPSEVVDAQAYMWNDQQWKNHELKDYIIYEMHVGSFTQEGTFEAVIPRLGDLIETGINAIEIMPVAQFPGSRNWGYDGVFPYAVQNSYGGPQGLKKLVDACHQKGIAVLLDVVYNHQGPEGNYLSVFAPYFSNRYHTPWGDAINFDWEWSDEVRQYYVQNTLYWLQEFHMDGLRFDAIHAIFDSGPVHLWEFLNQQVKALEDREGKKYHLIAESDLNDPRVLDVPARRGFGFDAQWLDDFHHALYKVLHPKDKDRYLEFGSITQLAKAYTDGFVHSGDEWVGFRKRKYGASSRGIPGSRFIAFVCNHDQVGNRPDSARPSVIFDQERQKLNVASLLLSPYVPMIFMGDEYAEERPFHYFVCHSDPELVEAVRKGRKEEFKNCGFNQEPADAQSEQTFRESVLDWNKRKSGFNQIMLNWHKELIGMRKSLPALLQLDKKDVQAIPVGEEGLQLIRKSEDDSMHLHCFFNYAEKEISFQYKGLPSAKRILFSQDAQWMMEKKKNAQPPELLEDGQSFLLPALTVAVYAAYRGKNIE